jgi:hypothetical protein
MVDDLDVLRTGGGPPEADPPLPIDADAVHIGAVAPKLFQPVSWRDSEITQRVGSVKNEKLPQRHPVVGLVELSYRLPLPDKLGVLVSERPQHDGTG